MQDKKDLQDIVNAMNKNGQFDNPVAVDFVEFDNFQATISVVEIENAGYLVDNFGWFFEETQEKLGYNPVFEYETDLERYDKDGEYISDCGIKHIPHTLMLNIYKGE